jgi:UDP-GlcNAc:undecaprenyl-phosphate GlcNAc-1-phosphate transferase
VQYLSWNSTPAVLAVPVLAFWIAVLLMPLFNRLAMATGFVDHPCSRKIHLRPTPLLGGLAVYAGVIVTLWLRWPLDRPMELVMLASLLMIGLGAVDDRLDLPFRYRLLLQVGIAAGLSFCGVRFHFFPSAALNHLVTVFWIVGVINAMNCLDCADGAAGATCLVVFATLAVLAAVNGRLFVAEAALAGLGAVLGFLIYNVPPARVFLGDTGSTFLGLMVAVLAILANPRPAGFWHLPLAPFVLSVPVLDIIWVHFRRYRAGIRSLRDLLASTGKDHVPHRLMAHGFSRWGCLGMTAYLSALAAGSVYGLATGMWLGAALTIMALAAVLWELESHSRIVIRPEDHVALCEPRLDMREPRTVPARLGTGL